MRIVVDAMGCDNHPVADVGGAVLAARRWPEDEYLLVGDKDLVESELAKHATSGLKLRVVHAAQQITMTDKASEVLKSKPQSSMHVGLQLLRDGEGDAIVSAGNTGALLAISILGVLRRIKGVKRPAIAPLVPIPNGNFLILDMGANADCRPEHLVQFAIMGSVYSERVLGVDNPRVALLSNGEEEGKGNDLVRESARLLAGSALNYIGNAEPKELLQGYADVAVADGFTANVTLKMLEAGLSMMNGLIRDEIRGGVITTLGGLLARPAFKRLGQRFSAEAVGGAPLLGVEGVVITAHGRSNDRAMMNAVRQARQAVESGMLDAIREGLKV